MRTFAELAFTPAVQALQEQQGSRIVHARRQGKAAPAEGLTSQSPRVIVSVTGFEPPREGGVEVVVKAQAKGSTKEQEIGRFGVFPETAFKAPDPSKAKRFGLPLPPELAASKAVTLRVYLVPFKGNGDGARLELGGAEIR